MKTNGVLSGIFIVIEGADGSGKATQFRLLAERLRAVGYEVEIFDFPRYEKPSSHFIKQYLNGHYGPAVNISPYVASIFYALDRYEAAPAIREALEQGKVVLSNRYVGSNMAHQGAKITSPAEQRGFFMWNEGLEYNLLGIPRPTLNLILQVPAELSFNLIAQRSSRTYTTNSHDEHEADINHLRSAVSAYEVLSNLFPKDFVTIECTKRGKMLSIPEVSDLIWHKLKPILPPDTPNKGRELIVNLDSFEVLPIKKRATGSLGSKSSKRIKSASKTTNKKKKTDT